MRKSAVVGASVLLLGAIAYGVVRHFRKAVPANNIERLAHFERAVAGDPSPSNLRGLADSLAQTEQFDKASEAYERASVAYRKIGDSNAGIVLERQSQRYETDVRMYFHRAPDPESIAKQYTA